jgi:hypothetical protein
MAFAHSIGRGHGPPERKRRPKEGAGGVIRTRNGHGSSTRNRNDNSREGFLKQHRDAHSLSIYDGRALAGFVVDRDGSRTALAFDASDRFLGAFPTRKAAIRAIPRTDGAAR